MKPFSLIALLLATIALSACSSQPTAQQPTQEPTPVSKCTPCSFQISIPQSIIEPTSTPICSSAMTQLQINQCITNMTQSEKIRSDSLIAELKQHMNSDQWDKLIHIESDWEKVAKDQCDWQAKFFEGGSIQPMWLSGCLYQQYKQRIDALRINLCEGNGATGECDASLRYK